MKADNDQKPPGKKKTFRVSLRKVGMGKGKKKGGPLKVREGVGALVPEGGSREESAAGKTKLQNLRGEIYSGGESGKGAKKLSLSARVRIVKRGGDKEWTKKKSMY